MQLSVCARLSLGLPVLTTPVGGIPEVIDKEFLFSPFDVDGFVNKLCFLIERPDKLTEMSAKNLAVAKEFKNSILQKRRDIFYSRLAELAKQ